MTILVTGASGNVGGQVLAQLIERGADVCALSRAADLPHVARGDLRQPAALPLDGVDAVFLMWPFHSADPMPALLHALEKRVRRVVLLSSAAGPGNPVGHYHAEVERLLTGSGLEWTILWPSTFAANALWWAGQIREGDTVAGPYGGAPMAMLHEADIAAVAVRALTEDGHHGARYRLTGPQVLTQREQVHVIGRALGRPLRWQELSRQQARSRLLADPSFPDSFVEPLLDGYAGMVDPPPLTDTVQQVTGVAPRTFHRWACDHAADFLLRTQ